MARLGVVYAPKALEDIDQLLERSQAEWGQEQMLVYAEALEKAVSLLRDFPRLGSTIRGLRKGQSQYIFGAHRIIYRAVTDNLIVVRVLHQNMDVRKHR